jgi:hypothetical protein
MELLIILQDEHYKYLILGIVFLIPLITILLYRFTFSRKLIKIQKKYTVNGDRFILGSKKTIYRVNHTILCIWDWNCKCDDLWNNLKESERHELEYYGINIPLINCYYNLRRVKN